VRGRHSRAPGQPGKSRLGRGGLSWETRTSTTSLQLTDHDDQSRVKRRYLALIGLVAGTLSFTACSGGPSAAGTQLNHDPPTVVLFGDSLAWEARGYFSALIRASGDAPLTFTRSGSALCDWLSKMRSVEARFHPRAVELEYSGNALTACMRGYTPPSTAYFEKYRADTLTAISIFRAGGAHVFLIGAPINRDDTSVRNWDELNGQYRAIAEADPEAVTYVDAGAAVEGPGHTFRATLPCLMDEPCTGPVVGGIPSNIVRAPDGGHFCPVEKDPELGIIGPCPVYSSGAYRYAFAMVSALSHSDS
jgi:hypothetical protein